ncbi:MAG: hypothetical protein HC878_03335 [Leptolyngbyaceae cyanobacterium SL_5_14]|nr:hypothetical protein [Leptolyngbyaceae cyanobacterium SL_5_14]
MVASFATAARVLLSLRVLSWVPNLSLVPKYRKTELSRSFVLHQIVINKGLQPVEPSQEKHFGDRQNDVREYKSAYS